jgi:metal-dependent amidase/aminoacylase/carboxypeptidase family protein
MIDDARLIAAVDARTADGLAVMRFVHAHPELGHEEHECSRFIAETLAAAGLEVERGVGGMPTAFRAELVGRRSGRTVGLVCLYDAVPAVRPDGSMEAVHSCGHGPIAGGVTAAALALADYRDDLAGRIVVMGCPSDEIHAPGTAERGGGKAVSAEAGLWDDVDAALYAHPEFIDTVSLRSRWMRREAVRVAASALSPASPSRRSRRRSLCSRRTRST